MSRGKKLVLTAALLSLPFVLYVLVEARIKVTERTDSEIDCQGSTDPYCLCMAIIGDENTCRANKENPDGTTTSWGTGCDAENDTCTAWIDCSDGTHRECIGEYKVKADQDGVWCQDTGDDTLAVRDYC